MNGWFDHVSTIIQSGLDIGNMALEGAQNAIAELSAIQVGMPAFVAKNIPQSIWDGLAKADLYISDNILPALTSIKNRMMEIDNMFSVYSDKISSLTDKIAHPGDMLLGVDSLPDYMRINQEKSIDEVANRQYLEAVNAGAALIKSEIDDFDLIQEALIAPTQEPSFLDIESPERAALTGIVVEPRETWFINGFLDTL